MCLYRHFKYQWKEDRISNTLITKLSAYWKEKKILWQFQRTQKIIFVKKVKPPLNDISGFSISSHGEFFLKGLLADYILVKSISSIYSSVYEHTAEIYMYATYRHVSNKYSIQLHREGSHCSLIIVAVVNTTTTSIIFILL